MLSHIVSNSFFSTRIMACCLALCMIGNIATAQDDLDYPDFRNKRDNFIKISEKDIRNDVASFAMAGLDESIGKAQLRTVPNTEVNATSMTFTDENVKVIIKTGVFFPTKHKLMYSEKHLVKIDGKPYYGGTYGEMPKTTIESIIVLVGKDTVSIPPTAFFDLYDPTFSYNQNGAARTRNGVYLANEKQLHTFYIYIMNPGGGGSEYTWVIRDKQYLRRVVDFGFLK